ncbi:MAG: hypothetical protein ACKOCQ_01030, partial [Candidatus Nitrosotenuis sp.]
MLQGTDGNWYAYFADRVQAQKADAIPAATGLGHNRTGLDFGNFCGSGSFSSILSFSSTTGIAVAGNFTGTATSGTNGQDTLTTCNYLATTQIPGSHSETQNVVRENKTLNRGVTNAIGNLITSSARASQFIDQQWPIIQLYDFTSGGNVVVQYNKGGGVQTTTLTFDSNKNSISVLTDRTIYPRGAQVHVTMKDFQLNIDPTDEDSWTFSTVGGSEAVRYLVTDENGVAGEGRSNTANSNPNIGGNLTALMFSAGLLTVNGDVASTGTPVLLIQDTADNAITGTETLAAAKAVGVSDAVGQQPVTFVETGPNTGTFVTFDESEKSTLKTTAGAKRDSTASITYNELSKTIRVGFGFGAISFDSAAVGAEWNSGEPAKISLTDTDNNKNGLSDEDLDV